MNALLLSAGLGTRFRPVTEKIPKPAVPFFNVPLLGYSLHHLELLGLKHLVLNTHHLPEGVRSAAEALTKGQGYSVAYSHEPKILGSGGGIKQAEKLLRANGATEFIVANSDEVMLFNHERGLGDLVASHRAQGALATLLTTDHPEAGRTLGGVWADANGQIRRLGGTHSEGGAKHFTGVFIFSTKIFAYMPEGGEFHIFKDCLHKAMAAGEKVLAFHDPALRWFDMSSEKDYIEGTRQAFATLNGTDIYAQNFQRVLQRFTPGLSRAHKNVWTAPKAVYDPALLTENPEALLFLGAGSELGRAVQVKGFVVLGEDAKFKQGFLENTVLCRQVHVHPLDSLRNQLVLE